MVGGGSPACPGRVHMHQRCSSPDLGRLGFQGIGEAHLFVFKELMVLILWRVEVGGKGGRIHHTCFHTGRICYVPQEGHRLALWGLRGGRDCETDPPGVCQVLCGFVLTCVTWTGMDTWPAWLSNHTSWRTEWSLSHRVVWECSLGTGWIMAICCLGCLRTHPGRPHLSWKCLQKPRQADQIPALQCSFFRNHQSGSESPLESDVLEATGRM